MTDEQARRAEVYEARIRERLAHVHVILYIARRDWLGNIDSVYTELTDATPQHRAVPIINVLPRGASARSRSHRGPGVTTVKWHPDSIINAIRQYAVPAPVRQLRLTRAEASERREIIAALRAHAGHFGNTASALGVSLRTLGRKVLEYRIPQPN
jgi:DNA-binding NtrC family response regulator